MPAPSSLPRPSKRRKISPKATTIAQDLEATLLQSVSIESLHQLLHLAQTTDTLESKTKCIFALYRTFITYITKEKLFTTVKTAEREELWNILNQFSSFLGKLLVNEDALQSSALQILLSIQKALSSAFSQAKGTGPDWHNKYFTTHIIPALLENCQDGNLAQEIVKKYLSKFMDLRWFFMRDAVPYMKTHPATSLSVLTILDLLSSYPHPSTSKDIQDSSCFIPEFGAKPPKPIAGDDNDEDVDVDEASDDEDDWRKFFDESTSDKKKEKKQPTGLKVRLHRLTVHQSIHTPSSHKAVLTRLWLSLLPLLPTDDSTTIRTLNILHSGSVLTQLTRPLMTVDWVSSCLDRKEKDTEEGGVVSILSLNLVWELMRGWNLDYPQFYTRLYALLTPQHSSQVHLVASFIKRLSLLSLSAPPSGIIIVLPLIYKLLKKNPSAMGMIHRTDDTGRRHPLEANQQHYHAAVATIARVFSEPFTREELGGKAGMEEWLDHGYLSMITHELARKQKKDKDPSVSFALEAAADVKDVDFSWVFGGGAKKGSMPSSGENAAEVTVVEELWDFGL
ncbi:hypothetical protein DL96DRAFT_1782671 [Flagelloscypha sp. PMI_526]|nr:hypothetical protein DL96DRAFT_1782671 [Flagelloscypha sp. PMI_526]